MAKINISEKLPKDFLKSHELLLYYNDIIVDILQIADKLKLVNVELEFKNENEAKEFKNENDPIKWLLENDYEKSAHEVVSSHIFFSLLTDFIFYMHESFSCSERGKVSVAYAISRKPIKDTLFHLCWLLARPKEYIDLLLHKEPKDYDVANRSVSPEFKKLIYQEACTKLSHTTMEFDSNLLYNLIYNKQSELSLNGAWDMSIHLVTTNKYYPTGRGDLNFVFSDREIWDEYWDLYYSKIPYIMNFMMEVTITIFENILSPNETTMRFNRNMRDLKIIISNTDQLENKIYDWYSEVLDLIKFECKSCLKINSINSRVKEEFILEFLFTCPYCFSVERVGQYYIFDKENII